MISLSRSEGSKPAFRAGHLMTRRIETAENLSIFSSIANIKSFHVDFSPTLL